MTPPLHILLLAAGSSQRFGGDKRRARLGDATVLQTSLALALQTGLPVTLVLAAGDNASELVGEACHHPRLHIGYADDAALGMGHSLAFGIGQLEDARGAMVMLADMPWLATNTLGKLVAAFDGGNIVEPVYQGRTGHPVIFPHTCFAQLAQLRGDRGGRAIINNNPKLVTRVDVNDPSVHRDIDKPTDMASA